MIGTASDPVIRIKEIAEIEEISSMEIDSKFMQKFEITLKADAPAFYVTMEAIGWCNYKCFKIN